VVDVENGDRFESFMTLPPITDAQKVRRCHYLLP
jgi:hypothetical protein